MFLISSCIKFNLWISSKFIPGDSRNVFRSDVNDFLEDYGDGYELSKDGEILSLVDKNLKPLFDANVPDQDTENIQSKVDSAVRKFRRRKSSIEDRKDAIRDLADVLEFLRPKLKTALLPEDERDLFNLANNFGIRHHNDKQKNHYDKPIWLSWMFYYYLATIHASTRLITKQDA